MWTDLQSTRGVVECGGYGSTVKVEERNTVVDYERDLLQGAHVCEGSDQRDVERQLSQKSTKPLNYQLNEGMNAVSKCPVFHTSLLLVFGSVLRVIIS